MNEDWLISLWQIYLIFFTSISKDFGNITDDNVKVQLLKHWCQMNGCIYKAVI